VFKDFITGVSVRNYSTNIYLSRHYQVFVHVTK